MAARPRVGRGRPGPRDPAGALIDWYTRARRDLPWRRTSDPYRVWVSEIMLQQTRAQAVIPYYERFLERFPTASALAAAAEDEVLALWSGLGYYSRARNLRRAAQTVAAAQTFPPDYVSIRALPGVGDYTAAAIASIAFGLPHAVLDGNVLRVVARLENDAADIAAPRTRARFSRGGRGLAGRAPAGRIQPGADGTGRYRLSAPAAALRSLPAGRHVPRPRCRHGGPASGEAAEERTGTD